MEPNNKPTDVKSVSIDLIPNLAKLAAALSVMAYFLGGPTTRAWMTGFISGTAFGLTGEPPRSLAGSSTIPDMPPLRLLGHGCHKELPYMICEGEVRNQSAQRLETVMAEVRFTDKDGTFVKAQSSLIDYQPLMPGQTSAFKVMTMSNPQIWHFSFGLREMFGGALKASR